MRFLITILLICLSTNLFAQKSYLFEKKNQIKSDFNSREKLFLEIHSEKYININNDNESAEWNHKNGYAYLSVGLTELVSFGVGLQINADYAIGIKYGGCWISKGFRYGAGPGLKFSRSLSSRFFNNINLEITTYTSSSVQFTESNLIKGAAIDLNIGNESKLNAINFIWSVGFITSVAKGAQPLFVPSLKIGFNVNF